ncbi:tripartite motif-containing protein 2-like [Anneissia japonica]|uniref:tripartite motif-containing protein 2-like n=1 Tax=Anneissia japonica TaxID=1529436 RepID=UPI0014255B33|nr:tripartite motif-containing protein 2-like [Anneissia japonica]
MAENKKGQYDDEEKLLECSICLNKLKQPKTLNCLHSFCMQCLRSLLKEKDDLICPTCLKPCPIPEGGLLELQPNAFINNLLEAFEMIGEGDNMECSCEKDKKASHYCPECKQYICSTCFDNHKRFPALKSHKLHSIEDVQSMTPLQFSSLHRQQCALHNEILKFYCKCCETVVCMHCAITDHCDGNHKLISIHEAFNDFEMTAIKVKEASNEYNTIMQDGLKNAFHNDSKLCKNKKNCLRDIENHVQKMVKIIKKQEEQLKEKVEKEHEKKKKENDAQIRKFKASISDVETKMNFLSKLLRSDAATALQSNQTIITALKKIIQPETYAMDNKDKMNNAKIHFFQNKQLFSELLQQEIGNVSGKNVAGCLRIENGTKIYATRGQNLAVKIIISDTCKINVHQLKATLAKCKETKVIHMIEESDGNFVIKEVLDSIGDYILDVCINGEPIKQSPMMINVIKEGLVKTIKVDKNVTDVAWCKQDSCLLVSFCKGEIYKYKQSGEYIGKISLSKGVRVIRMCIMKNGNLAFSDDGDDQCIKICTMNGNVVMKIGKGVLNRPSGVEVNDTSTRVYATCFSNSYVHIFDIDGNVINRLQGLYSGKIWCNDVSLTKARKLLISNCIQSRLEQFNTEQCLKVLVGPSRVNAPGGVAVDDDDNIILSSINKLDLLRRDGTFIKRIDKQEDGINCPQGVAVISYYPRRIAVTNQHDKSIKIFDY